MTLDATISGAASDTYITLAEWETYATNMGWVTVGTDAVKEVYLRRATQYLDREFLYLGYPAEEAQALQWPRHLGKYIDGYWIEATEIPQKLKDAQAEMAWLIHEGLDPFASTDAGAVKSLAVQAGSVSSTTVYEGGRVNPRQMAIRGLVSRYLAAGSGNARLVRA